MIHAEEDALIEQSIYDASSSESVNWRQAIRLAIRAAVAQERERCAMVCQQLSVGFYKDDEEYGGENDATHYGKAIGAEDCAAAIRKGE